MPSRRVLGIILLGVGIVVAILAIGADTIGLGQAAHIGYKQILGAIAGALVAMVGIFFILQRQTA